MKKILIVEDEQPLQQVLKYKLEKNGNYQIFQAYDGIEGLEMSLRERPDLIVLDIMMPKMDGMAMLKQLRKNKKWGENAKILMLTNLDGSDHVSQAAEQGVFDYLVKNDWGIENVTNKIEEMLKK
ncbi:MAG: response regulator [bacterium]